MGGSTVKYFLKYIIDRLKGGIWLRFHKPWVYLQLELPFRILEN